MKKLLLLVSFFNLASCSIIPNNFEFPDFSDSFAEYSEQLVPQIYKSDIKQGSVLRADKFKLINIGMSKGEVLQTIGSPSINDGFHRNQWDYIHYSFLKNDEILSLRITLHFDKDILSKIDLKNTKDLSKIESSNIDLKNLKSLEKQEETIEDSWYKFW